MGHYHNSNQYAYNKHIRSESYKVSLPGLIHQSLEGNGSLLSSCSEFRQEFRSSWCIQCSGTRLHPLNTLLKA